MSWGEGYNTEIPYTAGYYREQDPAFLDLCMVVNGATPPSYAHRGEKLRYLELGCGQGFNLCMIASQHPDIEFVGVDFNPQHVLNGKRLAKIAGLNNVKFIEASFSELKDLPDLGKFHYITSHGVISWIDIEPRRHLFEVSSRCLVEGGALYLSYNTPPAWISSIPFQHMVMTIKQKMALSSVEAVSSTIRLFEELTGISPAFSSAFPSFKARMERQKNLNINYLVHEYINQNWQPLWFNQVSETLRGMKFNYAGSATPSMWFHTGLLPEGIKNFLSGYKDPDIYNLLLDIITVNGFRKDIFVKGYRSILPGTQRQLLLSAGFYTVTQPQPEEGKDTYTYKTMFGEVSGKVELFSRIYEVFSQKGRKLQDAVKELGARNTGEVLVPVSLMVDAGHLAISRNTGNDRNIKNFNRAVMELCAAGENFQFLAPSVFYGSVVSGVADMVCGWVYLTERNRPDRNQMATKLVEVLSSTGRNILKDGKPVSNHQEAIGVALEMVNLFFEKTLPAWEKLNVI